MKALKTSVSVAELQKLIRQWKSRKITDSTISKLLDLYLGLTAYMNEERAYPIENFYDIKLSLRFPTTQMLIEAVKRCQSFPFVTDEDGTHIKAFYSPLWHEKRSETSLLPQTSAQELPQKSPQASVQTFAMDNIYNIYTKGGKEDSCEKQTVAQEPLATAKAFFHLVNSTPAQKAQILIPFINWFQQHEGLTRKHACENLVYLVNELLVPYFAGQERFMKTGHTGRLCWLNNLMKTTHGKHLLNKAAEENRRRREQAAAENRSKQRDNHPLNEFEWTDPETGMRFYDDKAEGAVLIPADAPPRPSANAVWNVLRQNWQDSFSDQAG